MLAPPLPGSFGILSLTVVSAGFLSSSRSIGLGAVTHSSGNAFLWPTQEKVQPHRHSLVHVCVLTAGQEGTGPHT